MAIPIGSKAFVCLSGGFDEPRWREAVVVGTSDNSWVTIAVRAKRGEEAQGKFSSFTAGGKTYFLSELQCHQLRAFPQGECLKLEAAGAEVAKGASNLLSSDPEQVVFATASEPEPPAAKTSRRQRQKAAEVEQSESSSSSSQDEVMEKLRKNWLGEDISGERGGGKGRSKKDKKGKFILLSKDRSKEKGGESSDHELMQLIAGMKGGADPIQALVALQLADRLKSRRKKKNRRPRSSSTTSSSSQTSTSSSQSRRRQRSGHARAIESYQASKRRMFKRPLHHVRKYIREVEREMGTEDGKPFNLTDYGRKISWGKQRNLQRCHFLFSDVLSKLLEGKTEAATLQVVLNLRAIHQTAIDGEWTVGWMLTHQPDVWNRRQWGGDPENLGHVANYLKSMMELTRNTEKLRLAGSGQTSDAAASSKDPLNKKKGGKGKDGKGKNSQEEDKNETK